MFLHWRLIIKKFYCSYFIFLSICLFMSHHVRLAFSEGPSETHVSGIGVDALTQALPDSVLLRWKPTAEANGTHTPHSPSRHEGGPHGSRAGRAILTGGTPLPTDREWCHPAPSAK